MPDVDPKDALRRRIEKELRDRSMHQTDLAALTKIATSTLSKIISGQILGTLLVRLDQLKRIETEFGLETGDLLREMRFVGQRKPTQDEVNPEDGTRKAIRRDPSLPLEIREAMIVLSEYYETKKLTKPLARGQSRRQAAKQGPPPPDADAQQPHVEKFVKDSTSGDKPSKPKPGKPKPGKPKPGKPKRPT